MSDILVAEKSPLVHITLNRPHALNALTHEMVRDITAVLHKYRDDDAVEAIIFLGAGDRAFCAGGDIKMVHQTGSEWIKHGRQGPNPAWRYFREEYEMNAIIRHYPKPVISLCHGFVMGGGYGIAGNGSHIIADDTTRFAMPETAIGFFPDVGIGWKLARCPDAIGMYVALTADIYGADLMMRAGLATHYVADDTIHLLHKAKNLAEIEKILGAQLKNPVPAPIDYDAVKQHFSKGSLNDIFMSLQSDKSDFATKTLGVMNMRSPMSMHVTFQHLKLAAQEDFDTAIARDYRLACAFFGRPDIYEGIRAAVIDKDRTPKWQYQEIMDISQADVDYYLKFSDHYRV